MITQQDRDRTSLALLSLVAGGLTFLAVLLLLSGAAQARSPSLPNFMHGDWCREGQVDLPGDEYPSLTTMSHGPCSKSDDLIKITPEGIAFHQEDWCSFKKVERQSVRTWMVWASCRSAGSSKTVQVKMVFEGWEGNSMMSLWEK